MMDDPFPTPTKRFVLCKMLPKRWTSWRQSVIDFVLNSRLQMPSAMNFVSKSKTLRMALKVDAISVKLLAR